ncbi:integrase core domain-containing protein, partial [Bifidobacterium longum]|uniref:integrase core domain-containing protein n=1 Tax=Bifidobacterium longum TaxID=216816 RepID=UPI001178B761
HDQITNTTQTGSGRYRTPCGKPAAYTAEKHRSQSGRQLAKTQRFPLDEIEVFHTDRGGGFAGERVERVLDVFGVTRSLSRPGNPYDSAVVESTNRLVRKELIHRNVYTNVEQLRSDVNRYVWWYNHQRLHSTLGYLSPVEFTQQGKTL